jgi:hypothetical protein
MEAEVLLSRPQHPAICPYPTIEQSSAGSSKAFL